MQQYSEYKASGVQWLGEIPSHWEVKRLGKICKFSKGLQFTKTDLVNQGIAVVSYGQVHAKYNKRTHLSDDLIRFIPSDFRGKNEKAKVEIGDFIVADTSEDIEGCGNMAFNDCIEGLYGGYHTILIKELQIACKKYLSYFFNCTQWRSQIRSLVNGVKVYTINRDILKQSNVICPSKEEQKNIVNYLDIVTSNIDKAITQQQKMIDLLNERKQIIINNAVTKGLNPNVKMKDSGVKWIGEIPEHWEVRKLKSITSKIGSGVTPRGGGSVYVDNGIMFLRSQNVYFEGFKLEDVAYITEDVDASMPKTRIREGDILFNITGGSIGRCHYVPQGFPKANVNQHVCIIRPNNFSSVYLYYLLRSPICQIQVDLQQTGGNREGLTTFSLKNFILPIPPKDEQQNIIKYLSEVDQKLEYSKQNFQKQISLLQERKQIIINDVVTGKVKVI